MPRPNVGRHNAFPLKKQGEGDDCCGLYCLLSAAASFRDSNKDITLKDVFDKLPSSYRTRLAKQLLFSGGVVPPRLRALAEAMNLELRHLSQGSIDNIGRNYQSWLDGNSIWMVLVLMRFTEKAAAGHSVVPRTVDENGADLHYVLVLEATDSYVVLADPHPWHKDIYSLRMQHFKSVWGMASQQRQKPPWAGCLTSRV